MKNALYTELDLLLQEKKLLRHALKLLLMHDNSDHHTCYADPCDWCFVRQIIATMKEEGR